MNTGSSSSLDDIVYHFFSLWKDYWPQAGLTIDRSTTGLLKLGMGFLDALVAMAELGLNHGPFTHTSRGPWLNLQRGGHMGCTNFSRRYFREKMQSADLFCAHLLSQIWREGA